jgi:hypothetical protein
VVEYYCDLCGKEIPELSESFSLRVIYNGVIVGYEGKDTDLSLCGSCTERIKDLNIINLIKRELNISFKKEASNE